MTTPEDEISCVITWNPRRIRLDELAVLTSMLADLHAEIAAPYVTSELARPAEPDVILSSPQVASLRMGSPLITELLAGSPNEWGIVALGMVGYILRNPGQLVTIWPRMQAARYRSKAKVLEAQLEYISAQGRLEAEGRPIEIYERVNRDHLDRVRELEDPSRREPQDRSGPGDRERGGRDL
jgi:hypothetical protein